MFYSRVILMFAGIVTLGHFTVSHCDQAFTQEIMKFVVLLD